MKRIPKKLEAVLGPKDGWSNVADESGSMVAGDMSQNFAKAVAKRYNAFNGMVAALRHAHSHLDKPWQGEARRDIEKALREAGRPISTEETK